MPSENHSPEVDRLLEDAISSLVTSPGDLKLRLEQALLRLERLDDIALPEGSWQDGYRSVMARLRPPGSFSSTGILFMADDDCARVATDIVRLYADYRGLRRSP
jgi:hypothetical protein